MKISIIVPTGRPEPRLDWIADGLGRQAQADDEIEIVVVDALYHTRPQPITVTELARSPQKLGPALFSARAVPVKPCAWQGPHRVTSRDWWSLSASRNTGIVHATHDYLVFLDDRCRLGAEFLATVRKGYSARQSVLGGSYDKLEDDPNAPGGHRTWTSVDHRFTACPSGRVNCGGGWLFGCAIALPLAWALDVNGFEEGCDGMGMEDVIFGLNLERAGRRIDFVPKMFVHQNRTVADRGPTYVKTDKGKSPNDKSHAALARFRGRARTEFTPNLAELRQKIAADDVDPFPRPGPDLVDWYDGQRIAEMVAPP